MSEAPKRGIVFRDPVHNLIHFDEDDSFILDLIDTVPMQRLRRVRQLGVSWLTYHGAEHSRFSHSMGVLHVAGEILHTLKKRYRGNEEVAEVLKNYHRTVLAAALLHDIGHAPFSHAMERLFPANADHEKRTISLINNPDLGIPAKLTAAGIKVEDVASILQKLHAKRFLVDIVSSQLDADRMDYLLRDSLFTGVEYGQYDLDWVAAHLCLGREPLSNDEGEPDGQLLRLCLDSKRGLYAAEQLIIARFHMTMQVYFHPTTRMWEALLLCLLRRAAEISVEDHGLLKIFDHLPGTPETLMKFLQNAGNVTDKDFLRLDDATLTTAMESWRESSDTFIAELSGSFLDRRKRLPDGKRVFECIDLSGKDLVAFGKLSGALESSTEKFPAWKWELDDIKEWASYKDFFHTLKKTHGAKNAEITTSIMLSDGNLESVAEPVEFRSFLFESMGENSVDVVRLYVHHSIAEEIKSLVLKFNLG
jgi:HD superfamily phosphohydrolase